MKQLFSIFFSFLMFSIVAPVQSARANHLLGGELFYEYVSGPSSNETYKLTMILYADRGSAATTTAFAALSTATPIVNVYNASGIQTTLTLFCDPTQSNIEITPVCPEQVDSTTCTSLTYVLPGVKKFTYSTQVTLFGTSADWRFDFEGNLVNSTAGRSTIIGNIVNNGAQLLFLEATLDNTLASNSSTIYTSEPTPFFCINTQQEYNLGAVDPNNDSLAFSMIPAKLDAFTNVTYIPPYTATQPVPAAAGSFVFNPINGQMSFIPDISMNCVVVNRVDEYRNGVKVGSNMREMTFVILPNCNNSAPSTGGITNLTNGTVTGTNEVSVCQGMTDTLSFDFTTSDPNGDSISITYAGLPAGASVNITNNNTLTPGFSFRWDVSTAAAGNYTFYVTLKDDGCPLSSKQTVAYTIKIVPFLGALDTGSIKGCQSGHNGMAWIHPQPQDVSTYQFIWKDTGGQVLQINQGSTTGDTLKNLDPGVYTVLVENVNGCTTSFDITVLPATYQAAFIVPAIGCSQVLVPFTNVSSNDFVSWNWDFGDNTNSSQSSPSHSYTQAGTYTVTLIGHTAAGCEDTATGTVTVHSVSLTTNVSTTDTICEGSVVFLYAEGAATYSWTPVTGLSCTTCNNPIASPVSNINYTVVGTDTFGCKDTAYFPINVYPANLNTSPDTSVCPRDSLMLRASGALIYNWSPSAWLSDTTVSNPVSHPLGNITYTVIGTFPHGCKDTQQIVVTVQPSAVINLADEVTIYPGESYQMNPNGNCLYFSWFPPLGLTNAQIANPVATPEVNTRYFVQATTEFGCTSKDSIDVYVDPETLLEVPNAFTPGSEPNGEIKVIKRGIATLKYFRIFNRWGTKVFESTDIEKGWDGRFNNTPQPVGVYVYMVEAYTNTGRKFYKQGNITLIR